MDQDGAKTKYLTLEMSYPDSRFNPSNQMVTYLSYLEIYRVYTF